ncbi:MAG: OmcA/MtrC family decaheme c-type cytochrome [Gammaproteobacteria bacterium]|nr:OmcA/MtrC family decaheme c-type cytochrome [Gammaproteobacteria bacterium]MDH5512371.1 OmcA/MtrC family decaheme c-type cytochrome [Gammaproteobacteria bacterium]
MNRKTLTQLLKMVLLAAFLAISGCADDGTNGADGADGAPGEPGEPGSAGGNVQIENFHGEAFLEKEALEVDGKYFVVATITNATASPTGVVTVDFTVERDGNPLPGATGFSFNINKLVPPPPPSGNVSADEISWNQWVPYIYRTETAGTAGAAPNDWPASQNGVMVNQASSENNGTLTDYGDGSYTYVFSTNISNVTKPVGGAAVTYERNLTHRVSLMMGGHSGPTDDDAFDFVPDGSPLTQRRNIVATSGCQGCHGSEFHGHGGNRVSVENCVTCHNPSNTDAQSGNTLDMKVMIHKIHMGGELEGAAGADGVLWNDPATPADETLDNGEYSIWGYRTTKHTWWKAEFPAVIENCTKCHQGGGENEANWKGKPSRAACGSCHSDVNFATGLNHDGPLGSGGIQNNDNFCTLCHIKASASDPGIAPNVEFAHDWTTKDPRHIAEFDVDLTVSAPANTQYFVAGERPRVRVILTDVDTGSPISHNTITTETQSAGEGCLVTGCPARDNAFPVSALFVHGPRARRVPVLTTTARVEVLALNQLTYNITGVSALNVVFDNGKDLYTHESGLSSIDRASVDVDLFGAGCTYVSTAAATPTEIMNCLNANSAFAKRGIAYLDEATNRLAIRSRNLGDFYGVQLGASTANSAIFNNTTLNVMGGFTVSATLAGSDPKITRTAGYIEYELDPVDDLKPGTYMVGVEISDRGRPSTTNYKTPSVKKAYFQVKQAEEEKAIANNCDTCHQSPSGKGYVLDFYRHNKIFDHTAVDQCGQCHDYQSASALGDSGSSDAWNGARPINRRVHAVHYGSSLNYPLLTVNYGNDDPVKGRNWDITFPRDIRNCEVCHSDTDTSGSWKTNPGRSPCSGCHDSDAATGHIKLMTYDPTPSNPWSGDELESCKVCH